MQANMVLQVLCRGTDVVEGLVAARNGARGYHRCWPPSCSVRALKDGNAMGLVLLGLAMAARARGSGGNRSLKSVLCV